MTTNATLLPELALAAETGARLIAGVDEVGRGALAGPVSIGVVVIDLDALPPQVLSAGTGIWPQLHGVRDSKLLTPAARTRWQPAICDHASAFSVQHGPCQAIDAHGLTSAMGTAGRAGLHQVQAQLGREVDMVILDGIHNWLGSQLSPPVRTVPKADVKSLTVACASVLAKVARDQLMVELGAEHPEFGWESNKGYGSAGHREAIRSAGPTPHHRMSWNLGLSTLPGL